LLQDISSTDLTDDLEATNPALESIKEDLMLTQLLGTDCGYEIKPPGGEKEESEKVCAWAPGDNLIIWASDMSDRLHQTFIWASDMSDRLHQTCQPVRFWRIFPVLGLNFAPIFFFF
jgi:hypothetical protein